MNIDEKMLQLKQQNIIQKCEPESGWGFLRDKNVKLFLSNQCVVETDISNRLQRLVIHHNGKVCIQEKHWPRASSLQSALDFAMEFGVRKMPDLTHCYQLHYYEQVADGALLDSCKQNFLSLFELLPVELQEALSLREKVMAPDYVSSQCREVTL